MVPNDVVPEMCCNAHMVNLALLITAFPDLTCNYNHNNNNYNMWE